MVAVTAECDRSLRTAISTAGSASAARAARTDRAARTAGITRTAGYRYLAVHADVTGQLAQPPRGRPGVRRQDLLHREHVGVQFPDHLGNRLVAPLVLRRVGSEQVEQVIGTEPYSSRWCHRIC